MKKRLVLRMRIPLINVNRHPLYGTNQERFDLWVSTNTVVWWEVGHWIKIHLALKGQAAEDQRVYDALDKLA